MTGPDGSLKFDNKEAGAMSALDHKLTFAGVKPKSASAPGVDIGRADRQVRFVPIAALGSEQVRKVDN
jgi:hypothetical protein